MADLHADLVECLGLVDRATKQLQSAIDPTERMDAADAAADYAYFFLIRHRDELLGVVGDAARYREWRRIAVTGCSDQFGDAMIAACEQQSETMVDAAIDAARHGRGE